MHFMQEDLRPLLGRSVGAEQQSTVFEQGNNSPKYDNWTEEKEDTNGHTSPTLNDSVHFALA